MCYLSFANRKKKTPTSGKAATPAKPAAQGKGDSQGKPAAAPAKATEAPPKKKSVEPKKADAKKPLGKKLPAVPESVLKRRKRRDAKKAAKLKVSLKVNLLHLPYIENRLKLYVDR